MRKVRSDARDVGDRSRIGRVRADARLPQPPEEVRTMRPIPGQDGKAQVNRTGPIYRSRNLDALDALETCAQLIGMVSPNLVVRVEAGEDPRGQSGLVRGEARDLEIRIEAGGAEL